MMLGATIRMFRKLNESEVKFLSWNYDKLRGKIKEVCMTQDAFAKELKIGRVSLSQRLNNQLEFTQDEIYKACSILRIPSEEISSYFFTPKV